MTPAASFRMAYQHVRAGFGRAVLSVVALALGVALVVAIQLMNSAVLESFLDTVDGLAGRAALTVTAGDGLTFDERIVEQVAKVPGVTLAVPLVTGVAFPDDDTGELLTVHGVDVGNDAAVRVYHRGDTSNLVDDVVEFLNSRESIILGREFAERRGLEIGSRLPLVTPSGVKSFTIRGLLDAEGMAKTLGGRVVVMDVYAAQLAFTARGQINQIDLLTTKGDEEKVRRSVAAMLPPGLKVEEPSVRKDVVRRTIAGFQAMLIAFALLAVLAGFLICYSRLTAIFEARTWEVGLMRAVGLRRGAVFLELLKESLVLGFAGTAIGIAAGVAIGRYGLPAVATATAINFRLPISAAHTDLTWTALAAGLVVGVGAAILAAAVPAIRLARRQPVAALRMRGREMPSAASRRSMAGIVLVTSAVAIALVVMQVAIEEPTLGNLATVAVAMATCAAARPLVIGSRRPLTRLWSACFGPTGSFAAWHVHQNARRAAFMVATIGIGVGVVVMFGMLGWSFERTLVARISTRTQGDLTITSAFVSGGYQSAPMSDHLLQEVLHVPGVASVAAQQRRDIPYGQGVLTVDGFDPECFTNGALCGWVLESDALPEALRLVAQGEGVLLTGPLARQLGLQPGDEITLSSPLGPQGFRIAAVTRSDVANVLIMSRDRYRRTWLDDMVTWVFVAVAEPGDVAGVQATISRTLGETNRLLVRTRAAFVDYLAEQARKAFSLLYIMEAIVFLLVLIGIGDTLATNVFDRLRQVGMMRAIGIRRGTVVSMVVLEACAIGLLGLLLATAAGTVLGTFWVKVQFPVLVGWALDLHFPLAFAAAGGALTIALCVIGALIPSLRAAYLPVATALRTE